MTRIYVHPVPVRLWHWINAVGFIVLIATGLQIRYGALLGDAFQDRQSKCTTRSGSC